MKYIISVIVLLSAFSISTAAHSKNPDTVTAPPEVTAPKTGDIKVSATKPNPEVEAWMADFTKYIAKQRAIDAEVTELKRANGIDILEAEQSELSTKLETSIPKGYHFDKQVGKLVEDPKEAPKVDDKKK